MRKYLSIFIILPILINGLLRREFNKTSVNEDMSFKTTNGCINICLPAAINA
jgi:hypothetical protein